MSTVIVVGAGQAGASLVAKLRALEFDGRIILAGEEPEPPYQRPPLSKAYLLGQMEKERLYLRPAAYYDEQKIELRLGAAVEALDTAAKTVRIGGETVGFDHLALTTGSIPRRLPAAIGGDLDGVYVVRGLADIDQIQPEFAEGRRVLIVGGGYIGLEAAAVARQKGLTTTLVEATDRILQRVASPGTSDFFRDTHRAHGVDLREGVGLDRLEGDGRVQRAVLAGGETIEVDFVIVGIGVAPAAALAESAGLVIDNGIAVDEFGQTSAPGVWAAGDCASFPRHGARIRLESVQNAIDQAEAVAANIMGASAAYEPKPWFWSDQYDVKLQIAGLNTGYDAVVPRPGVREGAQSLWYYRGGALISVDAMNDPQAYMVGKRMIEMGKTPAPEDIANPASDLKALLRG